MDSQKYVVRIVSSKENKQVKYQYLHDSLELREILRKIKDNKKVADYIVSAQLADKEIKLFKALIVVDFSTGSNVSREELTDGIVVDGINYVRYKRTASAAKSGHCFFIANEPLNKEGKTLFNFMHEWSLAGFDETTKYQNPVSWEAYSALTLSEIKGSIDLPIESIFIIPDEDVTLEKPEPVVRIYSENNHLRAKDDKVSITNKIWDGEGLLDESVFEASPDFSDKKMLLLRSKFFKSCVFKTKLQKWFEVNNITSVDMLTSKGFTLAKDIHDIKLVITESSLKYLKFVSLDIEHERVLEKGFKQWIDNAKSTLRASQGLITFGVVKTDKASKFMNGQMNQTSYQLINTLGLDKEQIEELFAPAKDFFKNLKSDPAYVRYYLDHSFFMEQNDASNESPSEEGKKENPDFTLTNYYPYAVKKLLSISNDFADTEIYKNAVRENITDGYKKRLLGGKTLINGVFATIFGNGAELLYSLIHEDYKPGQVMTYPCGNESVTLHVPIGNEIRTTRFETDKELLCMRYPHITMGNYIYAKNVSSDFYDEFFDLSREIVCVDSIRSNIMNTLNGCDFDSDFMLITDNEILTGVLKKQSHDYKRLRAPFVDIKNIEINTPSTDKEYECYIFSADKKISNNQIGKIVNLSQVYNSLFWMHSHLKTWDWNEMKWSATQEQVYLRACILAALSNVEIDSAKREFECDVKTEYLRLMNELPYFYSYGNTDYALSWFNSQDKISYFPKNSVHAHHEKKEMLHFLEGIKRYNNYLDIQTKNYKKPYGPVTYISSNDPFISTDKELHSKKIELYNSQTGDFYSRPECFEFFLVMTLMQCAINLEYIAPANPDLRRGTQKYVITPKGEERIKASMNEDANRSARNMELSTLYMTPLAYVSSAIEEKSNQPIKKRTMLSLIDSDSIIPTQAGHERAIEIWNKVSAYYHVNNTLKAKKKNTALENILHPEAMLIKECIDYVGKSVTTPALAELLYMMDWNLAETDNLQKELNEKLNARYKKKREKKLLSKRSDIDRKTKSPLHDKLNEEIGTLENKISALSDETHRLRSFNALLFSSLVLGTKPGKKHSLFTTLVREKEIKQGNQIETLEYAEDGDIEIYGYRFQKVMK